MPGRKSRMIGCLLGGAIGDAMGYPVEFMRYADIARYFGGAGVRDLSNGNLISDDTQMTLFTAEGLLNGQRLGKSLVKSVYRSYLRWYYTQFGNKMPGAKYEGDPWDLISYKVKAKAALPIVDIITLAATGSEYDMGGVISRTETNDKIGYLDPHLFPAVSFLDPTYTFTVSKKQTAAGCADAINHIMEQYFCEDSTLLNDGFMEAGLKSLMINAKKCLDNPEDYTARAEMMLDCTYGCNGIYSLGNSQTGWPCHGMEHALSAYYDITHGEGLAIITPRWMKHILSDKTVDRFVKYGVNVFGIDANQDKFAIADQAIEATYKFFESIGIPMHLRDVGIDESRIDEMAKHVADNEGLEDAWVPLLQKDIADIFRASL